MPEDLPTPKKSLKQLEKQKNKQLQDKNQIKKKAEGIILLPFSECTL